MHCAYYAWNLFVKKERLGILLSRRDQSYVSLLLLFMEIAYGTGINMMIKISGLRNGEFELPSRSSLEKNDKSDQLFREEYIAQIPEEERGDLMAAYHKRLISDDDAVSLPPATAWSKWEMATSRLRQDPDMLSKVEDPLFSR